MLVIPVPSVSADDPALPKRFVGLSPILSNPQLWTAVEKLVGSGVREVNGLVSLLSPARL